MIADKNFIDKLKLLGLNSYEAKLWLGLLSRGISTAGELSNIANVPRSRSYDVLETLEKKGFIMVKIGKPIKYLAISPEEVLDRVKKQLSVDLDLKFKKLDEAKKSEVIEELNLLYSNGVDMVNPTDFSGSLKGSDSVYDQMNLMIKEAEKSIIIAMTNSEFKKKIPYFMGQLRKANNKGVTIRIVVPLDNSEETKNIIKELSKIAEVRDFNLKSRFVAVDNEELLFMISDDKEVHPQYDMGIWVNTPFFTQSFTGLFEQYWNSTTLKLKH